MSNRDAIWALPVVKGAVSHEEYTSFINTLAMALNFISPLLNSALGQVEPGLEFKRLGHPSFADGTNWNPTSPQYASVAGGAATTAGGATTETITVTGATASDIPYVSIKTQGASPTIILRYAAVTDGIEITFASDPGNDHVVQYLLFRNTGKGFYYYDTTGSQWRKLG